MGRVVFELSTEEAKAVQGFLRVVDAQRKTEDGMRKAGRAGKDADGIFRSMASSAMKDLAGMAAGWATVAGGIKIATSLTNEYNAARDRSLQGSRTAEDPYSKLAQFAILGDQGKLKMMKGEARKTALEEGVDLSRAAGLQAELENLDLGSERRLFAPLFGIADPSTMAKSVKMMGTALGKEEVGSPREVLNKIFTAAKFSGETAEAMAPAAASAAQPFASIGGTDEELLAFLGIMGNSIGVDESSTQLSALADVVNKRGLQGKTFADTIANVSKAIEGMSGEEELKFFGRKEGRKGFKTIERNLPQIMDLQKQIEESGRSTGSGDVMEQMLRARFSDPDLSRTRELRRRQVAADLAEMDNLGPSAERREMMIEDFRRQQAEHPGFFSSGVYQGMRAVNALPLPDSMKEKILGRYHGLRAQQNPTGSEDDPAEFLRRAADAIDNQKHIQGSNTWDDQ